MDETLAHAHRFDAEELENSFPLDVGRRFRDEGGQRLVMTVLDGMRAGELRRRRRRASVEEREWSTVDALLANLAAAAFNVVDQDRFAAVSFNRNDYIGSELSLDAMRQCRDYLLADGLIEGEKGFQRLDAVGDGVFGRRTRIRATDQLRVRFDAQGIGRKSLARPRSQLIRIKSPGRGVSPVPPDDIEESRALLEKVNARLASVDLDIADTARAILGAEGVEDEGESGEEKERKRRYAGDLTATSMYRSFSRNWTRGGRIYGGWWMSVPRALRPHITIEGERLVELDYSALHPRLLFHREGLPLDFDPYLPLENRSPDVRELGKRTFNRLLNRDTPRTTQRLQMRAARGDRQVLPKGLSFAAYRNAIVRHLHAIEGWFGTGVGVHLQREDSDLAVAVLRAMEEAAIPVLPVHDSFLVQERHRDELRRSMEEAFFDRYGFMPRVDQKSS